MSKLEKQAFNQLIDNIGGKASHSKDLVKYSDNKNRCIAASRFESSIIAYDVLCKGDIEIYIVEIEKNGTFIPKAYKRCCRSINSIKKNNIVELKEGEEIIDDSLDIKSRLCISHKDSKSLKIFDTDILPKNTKDSSRRLATKDDPYFTQKAKSGRKKKISLNSFIFDSKQNPILIVLNHKNRNLYTSLMIEAAKLLKNKSDDIKIVENSLVSLHNNETKFEKTDELDIVSDNESVISFDKSEEINLYEDDDNEEDNEQDNDKNQNENEEDDDEDDDDDEGVSCEPIFTNKNKQLWYNDQTNMVYEPEGDDSGEELGFLKEVPSKYETIRFNDKSYTVMLEIQDDVKGNIFCCVLSNKLFKVNKDDKLVHIGKRSLINDKEFKLEFNK